MRRFLAVQLLWVALACSSSGGNNNDASGAAGTSGSAGTGGSSAAGTSGGAGTTGAAGTTGGAGRGGAGGSAGSGVRCLAFDAPGLDKGTACPNTSPPCYASCDFDGDQYVGCITGSTEYTECYGSCGSCP